jgi:hypothetical protein
MRYGNEKAIGGPGVVASVSMANFFGVEVGPGSFVEWKGDGSIVGVASELLDTTGSGNAGIEPSVDEVSIVMVFVSAEPSRMVYSMGEHLITTDGFL